MSSKTSFSSFFSPPRFLEMSSVGLDISDQTIRFMEFAKSKIGLLPRLFGEEILPAGAITSGEIIKKDELVKALSVLKEKYSLSFVKASLPEEKAYFFKTEIPKVEEGEIRQSIEFKLEENVPLRADEALFDYSVIDEGHKKKDHWDVSVSVAPKRMVLSYAEILDKAGLTPVSFEVESKAIARSTVKTDYKSSVMIINIKDRITVISLVRGGVVRFTSTLNVGGNLITEALRKNFSVSLEEARKIKEEKLCVENKESVAIFFSLVGVISSIKDEVVKLYAYWLAKNDSDGETGEKIDKIILCGRDSVIVGLKEYLSQSVKVEVEIANVWTNAFSLEKYLPEMSFSESLDFAVAVGLAIPDCKK